jgi:hypothetical protein
VFPAFRPQLTRSSQDVAKGLSVRNRIARLGGRPMRISISPSSPSSRRKYSSQRSAASAIKMSRSLPPVSPNTMPVFPPFHFSISSRVCLRHMAKAQEYYSSTHKKI